MNETGGRRWLAVAAVAAFVYAASGVGFAALAGMAGSAWLREAWRLAAWVVSGLAFLGQIAWERFSLRERPRATAWHAALAVAVGMFALAAVANLHPHPAAIDGRLRLALILFPLITAVPAAVAALVLSLLLGRLRREG